jgi:N-acylneuraminate cytidylyltransferase
MKAIAIIPARRGSKRLPGKNMAILNGKPLLQYAIESAMPDVFDTVVVSSDWDDCLDLARKMGVEALKRPAEICQDTSHDFEFVKHALEAYPGHGVFAILRPTSPFRTRETVVRAVLLFFAHDRDSMRAVESVKQHPWKMWTVVMSASRMFPYERVYNEGIPAYDLGTQTFPKVYAQNGCLHIAKADVITRFGNVSGDHIAPFFTHGLEGWDINEPMDLEFAEFIMKKGGINVH